MTTSAPSVAVVIPARNAAGSLANCLEALRREGVPGAHAELIVVDDASADETGNIAAEWGAQVLTSSGRGPATARNAGASLTHADIVVFLDADTAPEPGWLEAMLAPFADPTIVAVKGRYVTRQRGLVPRFAQLEFEDKYARLERAVRVDFVDTATAAFRRAAFMNAGGFDESFPAQSAEDVDLAFRMADQGAGMAFNPLARVQHVHATSLLAYLHKKARYGFFRVTIYRRYPAKITGDSYTPPWMSLQIIAAGGVTLGLLGRLLGLFNPGRSLTFASVVFAATCFPLQRRAWVTDRAIFAWIVPLTFLRALAQGLGLSLGLARALSQSMDVPMVKCASATLTSGIRKSSTGNR
jgi:cellulose synthase/poly-beta-1,6-N-acetylglucosamine synthase-like glycosyltransferase